MTKRSKVRHRKVSPLDEVSLGQIALAEEVLGPACRKVSPATAQILLEFPNEALGELIKDFLPQPFSDSDD